MGLCLSQRYLRVINCREIECDLKSVLKLLIQTQFLVYVGGISGALCLIPRYVKYLKFTK